MSGGRYARRRDENEGNVIAVLEAHGCVVEKVRDGRCDLWVWRPGWPGWIPIEVKSRTGRLTKSEEAFSIECARSRAPYAIVRSELDALEAVGLR